MPRPQSQLTHHNALHLDPQSTPAPMVVQGGRAGCAAEESDVQGGQGGGAEAMDSSAEGEGGGESSTSPSGSPSASSSVLTVLSVLGAEDVDGGET